MVGNASYSSSLSALSRMSPSSWLMDPACCNHMTPHSSLFSELKPAPYPLNIHTTNGSTMSGHNIGLVSTSNLLVPGVFNVPDLSYNTFFMGQLAELGYRIIFDYFGCTVQDPRTGQELGIVPRVWHMFPIDNLRLPLCCSCFFCCSYYNFFNSFPCTLACLTYSHIFLLGTTIGFQRFVRFNFYKKF